MESKLSVRAELSGKTDMSPENENDLFDRLEEIEKSDKVVDPLSKRDWIGVLATFLVLGILPLLYEAFILL